MKTRLISTATLLLSSLTLSFAALAESPVCAESQDDSWMQPEALQEQVQSLGYTIERLAISEGFCYEMSGLNKDGQSITAFLDPVTGAVVQEDVAQ